MFVHSNIHFYRFIFGIVFLDIKSMTTKCNFNLDWCGTGANG